MNKRRNKRKQKKFQMNLPKNLQGSSVQQQANTSGMNLAQVEVLTILEEQPSPNTVGQMAKN